MSRSLSDLVGAASAGQPVYISVVREQFEALPHPVSFRLTARLAGFGQQDHEFTLTLPRFSSLSADERELVTEYVLASLYNIVSALGGRGLSLITEGDAAEGAVLAAAFEHEFGIGQPRLLRHGYGRAINVSERLDEAISPEGTLSRGTFRTAIGQSRTTPTGTRPAHVANMGGAALCRRATSDLHGTAICGVDIGGTDIKLCLAMDGQVTRLLEYDWFPAGFTTIDQIIDPILALVHLMCLDGARASGSRDALALQEVLAPAFADGTSTATIQACVRAGESLGAEPFLLDAIGVCFPDVVVRDKIVGGEVYKTRGLRNHLDAAYETEFRRLSCLDEALRAFVKPDGVVGIVNDGPMAAFTAAIELGTADPAAIANGVFAHTLGTELGTGWVTEQGSIPDIPLEIYNCIIDLGSHPERRFSPDDVRSVNNFNTRLPGTLQKYTSQSGVFRLAAKYLPEHDPALFAELLDRGLLVQSEDGLFVPTAPADMRKPLLEFLMQAAECREHPAVDRIFRDIGEFMAVAWHESKWLLDPAADRRILLGRLVKRHACFDLMVEGARSIAPGLDLVVADDDMANTGLMRQLRGSERYSVAQFAQAIGAVHYANFRRHMAAEARAPGGAVGVG